MIHQLTSSMSPLPHQLRKPVLIHHRGLVVGAGLAAVVFVDQGAVFPQAQLTCFGGGEAEDGAVAEDGREVEASGSAAAAFPAGAGSPSGS